MRLPLRRRSADDPACSWRISSTVIRPKVHRSKQAHAAHQSEDLGLSRGGLMQTAARAAAAALFAVPLIAAAQWNVPPESQRCPSKWGPGDEKGSGNHTKNPKNIPPRAHVIKPARPLPLRH